MRPVSALLEDSTFALIALCAYAGLLSCTNHTAVQELTAKRYAISIASSIFMGIIAINLLDETNFSSKFKLGIAVGVGYAARPFLDELYRAPVRIRIIFEKRFQGKEDK